MKAPSRAYGKARSYVAYIASTSDGWKCEFEATEPNKNALWQKVAVLSMSEEAQAERVARLAQALFERHQTFLEPKYLRGQFKWKDMCETRREHWYEQARFSLTSLNLVSPRKKKAL